MNHWIDTLAALAERSEPCVLLTITGVRGSAPREVGARMVVTADQTIGTIGGGQLEHQCTQIACRNLANIENKFESYGRRFPLGANCGQCCGGVVDVMFESIDSASMDWINALKDLRDSRQPVAVISDLSGGSKHSLVTAEQRVNPGKSALSQSMLTFARDLLASNKDSGIFDGHFVQAIRPCTSQIAVFGAGHVGTAVVDALSRLDVNVRWIDSRRNIFPATTPDTVFPLESANPALEVDAMPAGTSYLIMTHSHPLDLDICLRVLRRKDVTYCGLIGSLSKRRRFERLMRKQGLCDADLTNLTCPIGVPGIESKKPTEIAVSVAAEILQVRDGSLQAQSGNEAAAGNLQAI